jgi:hypothetical protein
MAESNNTHTKDPQRGRSVFGTVLITILIVFVVLVGMEVWAADSWKPSNWFQDAASTVEEQGDKINIGDVTMPVIGEQTADVTLHFTSEELLATDCGGTIPINRQIMYNTGLNDDSNVALARVTVMELFEGPSEGEKSVIQQNLTSSFEGWGPVLESVSINDNVAQVNFGSDVFDEPYSISNYGSSCGSGAWQQIIQTLIQLEAIDYVIFAIDDSPELWNTTANPRGCPVNQSPNETDEQFLQASLQCNTP